MTDFLDVTTLPIRAALGRRATDTNPRYARKVALITQAADGISLEKSVRTGDAASCGLAAVALIQERRTIILDGFPLEEVAELCFEHNYRWRFHNPCPSQNGYRFLIEPGKNLDGDAREARF